MLFLLRVSLGELELWGLCPDAQPTSPEMQALSGHTPLETANRSPSPWCPWKRLWCLLLWGESRDAPDMQRATVPTGWEGARRLPNSVWILLFKGIGDVALPTFGFTSDAYFVLRCSYWKLPDVFLELHRLALACGFQSFTPLRIFTIISELIYTTLGYYTSECSFHRVQPVKAWKGENKKKSVLRN